MPNRARISALRANGCVATSCMDVRTLITIKATRLARDAVKITRLLPERAASSGTIMSQAIRKDCRPPVRQAPTITKTVKLREEIRCAVASCPVRERKATMAKGERNQNKTSASKKPTSPVRKIYSGYSKSAATPLKICEVMKS